MLKIDVPLGINHLVYHETLHLFATAGYENVIRLYTLDPVFFDQQILGELVGHTSMVSAVTVVQESPMLISADDSGSLRVWDLRLQQCLQTVFFAPQMMFTKIVEVCHT